MTHINIRFISSIRQHLEMRKVRSILYPISWKPDCTIQTHKTWWRLIFNFPILSPSNAWNAKRDWKYAVSKTPFFKHSPQGPIRTPPPSRPLLWSNPTGMRPGKVTATVESNTLLLTPEPEQKNLYPSTVSWSRCGTDQYNGKVMYGLQGQGFGVWLPANEVKWSAGKGVKTRLYGRSLYEQ